MLHELSRCQGNDRGGAEVRGPARMHLPAEFFIPEARFNDFIERVYEFIGGYVSERQSDGAFRELNPRIVVRSFLGMLIHHSLNNILWDKKRVILNISNEEAAKNFAEILLRGIRA